MKHSYYAFLLALAIAFQPSASYCRDGKYEQGKPQTGRQTETNSVKQNRVIYDDWFDQERQRHVPVKIYLPESGRTAHPVVVFSHGLGGSREAAQYLGEYWSDHGYVSVHVQHIGSDSSLWEPVKDQGHDSIIAALKTGASPASFFNRAQDISFVLNEIEKRNQEKGPLQGVFDTSRMAIAGHSFGANTALTMAGQRYFLMGKETSFTQPAFKAAIYLSPPADLHGRSAQEVFGAIKIPGLLFTGTEDVSPIKETTPEQRRIPFDGISAAHQYLITFIGGDHMIFNGARRRAERPGDKKMLEEIERVTTAFLDAYLLHNEDQLSWLNNKAAQYVASDAKMEQK